MRACIAMFQHVMVDYKAIQRIAYENVEDAAREYIDYIELRFSPSFMANKYQLEINKVTEAVCEGVQKGIVDFPIRVNLILIMLRNYGIASCYKELESAIRFRDFGVVAIDLAGDELNFPGDLFVDHFRKARNAGLHATAHAGEAAGPESVKQAILGLGVSRIGHGIQAIKDVKLLDLILEKEIGLETCLTSNIHTNSISSYQQHPLPEFSNRGILATINTDDPGISGIDLSYEYKIAEKELKLDKKALKILQENALEISFMNKQEKNIILMPYKNSIENT